jgi:gamma-glutamyltranspeptidase/glutathione hydrolase
VDSIGGGGFALIRLPNGTYSYIDFREAAPAAATENMYTDNPDASLTGGLAAGVPGELRGLELMHNSYGSLPWHTLFQPAIRFARNGFRINSELANAMDFDKYPFLDQDPAWAEDFSSTKARSGWMTRKRYANTLEKIARGGADVFYKGPLAERFVATVQKTGGIMTMKDMASYEAKERKVVHGEYKGYRVHTCGSPSSGAVALSAWKIFEGFNKTDDRDVETHRMIEATKFAYAQRTVLGDPDFVDGVDEFEGEMVDEKIAAQLRVRIKDDRVLPNISFYNPAGLRSPTPYVLPCNHIVG